MRTGLLPLRRFNQSDTSQAFRLRERKQKATAGPGRVNEQLLLGGQSCSHASRENSAALPDDILIVTNAVPYTLKCVKSVDLMLCVFFRYN